MRLIDSDKIHPDVRTQRGALAISQGQLAHAETVNAILIPDNATNGDIIKALFPNVKFVYFEDRAKGILMSRDWWNMPYRNNKDLETVDPCELIPPTGGTAQTDD